MANNSASIVRALEGPVLKSLLSENIRLAQGFFDNVIDAESRDTWDRYYQRPYGDERDGRSRVITSDVQDYVEQAMPTLVEIFLDQEDIWHFDPKTQQDLQAAKDATEAVNHVVYRLNPGWSVIHDAIKASLMFKVGYVKVCWEEGESDQETTMRWQDVQGLARIVAQAQRGELEIVGIDYSDEDMAGQDLVLDPRANYDVQIKRDVPGYPKIECVPYEEILSTPNIADLQDAPFVAHRYKCPRSDLIEEGHDPDLVYSLPTFTEMNYQIDRVKRHQPEPIRQFRPNQDPSMQEVQIYECYLRGDFDGDGVAEYGMVKVCGNGAAHTILPDLDTGEDWTPIIEHPIVDLQSIKLPNKFLGRCIADIVKDTQRKKTVLQRQMMDGIYQMHNGRDVINKRVEENDYLNNVPGMPIRVKDENPVNGAVMPLATQPTFQHMLPISEYFDQEAERKTGVTFSSTPYDSEAMKATFGGLNLMLGETMKRQLYCARTIGEGLAVLPKKILNLMIQYQGEPIDINSGQGWRKIDPRPWSNDMNVRLNINFAVGTNAQKAAMVSQIVEKQEALMMQQGGVEGPLTTLPKYLEMLHAWAKANGLHASDIAFNTLEEAIPQYQQKQAKDAQQAQQAQMQNPVAMQFQLESAKVQARSQADAMKIGLDERLGRVKLQLEDARERDKIGLQHQSDILDMRLDHETDILNANLDHDADIYKANLDDGREQTRDAFALRRQAQNDYINVATKGTEQ